MTRTRLAVLCAILPFAFSVAQAQDLVAAVAASPSSLVAVNPAPAPAPAPPAPAPSKYVPASTRPFRSVGVAVKVGTTGIGFDVATPLAKKLNLRGGADFFNYNLSTSTDGLGINGTLKLKSSHVNLDFFPWGGGFHLSPGVTFYNGNHASALVSVPGGQSFTLNDVQYYSNPSNPISGNFDLPLGNKVAPSFTIGFSNIVPRHGARWSIPFDVGVQYIGQVKSTLTLSGSGCTNTTYTSCQNMATNAQAQQNIQGEQNTINNDLNDLQAYPIVSIGFGWKFGK